MTPSNQIEASLSLAQYVIGKLKHELPDWNYILAPLQIICLQECGKEFAIEKIIYN